MSQEVSDAMEVRKRRQQARRVFERYLQKLRDDGIELECPVCHFDHFDTGTLEVAQEYDHVLGDSAEEETVLIIPRVVALCMRCGHLIEFAWLPIEAVAKREGWL